MSRIWVRNHHDGGWICAVWTHLTSAPAPFGDQAWDQARQILARRGQDAATEAEIARAVADLLDKAEAGPGEHSATGRRVAARTRATARDTAWLERQPDPPRPPVIAWADDEEDDEDQLAEVIPLGIFDAKEEARKWW